MEKKRKIVFILGSLSQPRCIKRIISFSKEGFDVKVYGYNRGKYNCNVLPADISVEVLGKFEDGKSYVNKMFRSFVDMKRIIKKHDDVVFYVMGFSFAIQFLFKSNKFIYEISDIFYGYPRFKRVLPLLKFLDKQLIRRSFFTVLTSEGFIDFFYKNKIPSNLLLQPNRVNTNIQAKRVSIDKEGDSISFGFVGALRYNSIYLFAEIIGKYYPKHAFKFYGESSESQRFKDLADKYDNIYYYGKYKNPEDLDNIYSTIDVVVASYDCNSLNERIAEPNKLYESLYFCRPIVVSSTTFLAKQVEHYKCGYAINPNSKEIKAFIDKITIQEIKEKSKQIYSYPESEFLDSSKKMFQKFFQLEKDRL